MQPETKKKKPEFVDSQILKEQALNSFYYWYLATMGRSKGIPKETILTILSDMAKEYCQIRESGRGH
jgi:hypothetical protein